MRARINSDRYSPSAWGKDIERYCGVNMLDVDLFSLRVEGLEIAEDPAWDTIEVSLDIEAAARQGELLGWRREWCPFAGDAQATWHRAFGRG